MGLGFGLGFGFGFNLALGFGVGFGLGFEFGFGNALGFGLGKKWKVWNLRSRHYGTKVRVSEIEERNVWGAEIYGRGFTVRVKSGRCGISEIDTMGQRLEFQRSKSVMLGAQKFTVEGLWLG